MFRLALSHRCLVSFCLCLCKLIGWSHNKTFVFQLNDLNAKVGQDANRLKEAQGELNDLRNRVGQHNTQIESLRSNVIANLFLLFDVMTCCLGGA